MMESKTQKHTIYTKLALICSILAILSVLILPILSMADQGEVSRLNREINQKKEQMERLDAEIAKQRQALNSAAGKSRTLQNAVTELEQTRRKLQNDINLTQTEIDKAELTIKKLNLEINESQKLHNRHSEALAESIRKMNQIEQVSLIERFLGFDSMTDFWINFELTQKVQEVLHDEINGLLSTTEKLQQQEIEKKTEREHLAKQVTILAGETEVIKSAEVEKESLLRITKNEESEYQRLLNQKMAERRSFEEEMLKMESQLNFLIDPGSYPAPRRGVLSWPLDNIRITQQFGGSQFATQNPHIYGRPFHPGTDYAAPIGTQVKSVYGGQVRGMGNTDNFPGCNAWGRWLLIDHDNGLSSLYAHLSSNLVTIGQRVERGEVVALSGNTGYSTGPHLHLTIYATQGVRIGNYTGAGGCASAGANGPFADLEAYLDPMLYLPSL